MCSLLVKTYNVSSKIEQTGAKRRGICPKIYRVRSHDRFICVLHMLNGRVVCCVGGRSKAKPLSAAACRCAWY